MLRRHGAHQQGHHLPLRVALSKPNPIRSVLAGEGMEGLLWLTAGAVREIWELPNGPGTIQPVLQVADLRAVTTKNPIGHQSERYRMLLSDGVHSQQSMLSTNHNHLVKTGALRQGAIVHLQDITCNTIQNRR